MDKPKPDKKPAAAASATRRILPMDLQLGDRIVDETGEYEVVGRPYTTAAGKNAHVRVRRVDNAEVAMIRSYSAHQRIRKRRLFITPSTSPETRRRPRSARG